MCKVKTSNVFNFIAIYGHLRVMRYWHGYLSGVKCK